MDIRPKKNLDNFLKKNCPYMQSSWLRRMSTEPRRPGSNSPGHIHGKLYQGPCKANGSE